MSAVKTPKKCRKTIVTTFFWDKKYNTEFDVMYTLYFRQHSYHWGERPWSGSSTESASIPSLGNNKQFYPVLLQQQLSHSIAATAVLPSNCCNSSFDRPIAATTALAVQLLQHQLWPSNCCINSFDRPIAATTASAVQLLQQQLQPSNGCNNSCSRPIAASTALAVQWLQQQL